ncbi:hypothetical protein [Escherichia albertii]|uniref:hypothetical protein n=1 Tax=Escherichia albertii TaxID=208962 RepID=UPI0010F83742|nr:hypothetical protein [Escherichia albertii]MCZ8650916.1 hypothetical protein [Escherichia albertii]WDB35558.1 hypothetical protein PS032_06905 [Escherichia albertii]
MFPLFRKPEVRLLKQTPAGVIFSVRSGKGFLRRCVIHKPHSYGLIHSLCWQDVPLIRFWSETGCPTCAEFVYSGFADDEQGAAQFLSALENWNRPWSGMADAFAALTPLFSCLADGYYLLEDRELYPTDGNGHFFWAATDHSSSNPATVAVWDPEYGYFSDTAPCFLLPGQPPSHFNSERATFYRDKPDARALAWYLTDSYLCVLLDGHHKATAAALEGRPLKTLVFPGGECLHKTELQYRIPKLTAWKTLPLSAWEILSPDKHVSPFETWSEELKQSVSRYPSLDQAWQIVEAGNLSETRIKRMIQQGLEGDEKADVILQALFFTHSPLFVDFARFVISHPAYAIYRALAFRLMAQHRTPQADAFFLDFAINDDGERPELTKIMDDYFRKP